MFLLTIMSFPLRLELCLNNNQLHPFIVLKFLYLVFPVVEVSCVLPTLHCVAPCDFQILGLHFPFQLNTIRGLCFFLEYFGNVVCSDRLQ
jgi:hypothetical protein